MSKSTHKNYTQEQITKILYTVYPEADTQTVKDLHIQVWKNPGNSNSLHLSTYGWSLISKLKMTCYKYKFDEPLTPRVLLQLERYLLGPYYIYQQGRSIAILDEQDHIMLSLQAGNLAKYLDDIEKYS